MFGPKILMDPTDEGGGANNDAESLEKAKHILLMTERAEAAAKRELEIKKELVEKETALLDLLSAGAEAELKRLELKKAVAEEAMKAFDTEESLKQLLKDKVSAMEKLAEVAGRVNGAEMEFIRE